VGELAAARRPDGFVEVTPFLQVAGQDRVFAVGDVSTADHKMAGAANRQAQVIADNIRTLISGEGDLRPHEPAAPGIVVPIGPHGGAGQRPNTDELVPAETVAELKGCDMMVTRFAGLFGITPPDAEADSGR
jgi:NADH dehydrogenase FAD-containing subunit